MADLSIRPASDCPFDAVSLGEVMLRQDPEQIRKASEEYGWDVDIATVARIWRGGCIIRARLLAQIGGEYAAQQLATLLVAPSIASGLEGRSSHRWRTTRSGAWWRTSYSGGPDTSFIQRVPYNGIGRGVRNGLNFTERGFGVRGAVGVSDRGHTAASPLKSGDSDWDHLIGELGVRGCTPAGSSPR